MLTRTAIYEGKIKSGQEDEFFRQVENRLDPIWRQFPNVQAVRVQRVASADADAPPIAMIMEMDFSSQAAMHESLASPIRETSHAETLEVMQLFEGRFYHLVTEAQFFTAAEAEAPAQLPTAG
jgi:hypothetical protein